MKLFYVCTKVRPQPEHPLYWEMQFGYVGVFVWAADQFQAVEKSDRFIPILPLDVVGEGREVTEIAGAPADDDPLVQYYRQAMTAGFSFALGVATTGADEEGFDREFEPDGAPESS